MLTATFVQIENVDLPESDSKTVASTSIAVTIDKDLNYFLNGAKIRSSALEGELGKAVKATKDPEGTTITIIAEVGVPFTHAFKIMKIASKLKTRAIIATQPTKG